MNIEISRIINNIDKNVNKVNKIILIGQTSTK